MGVPNYSELYRDLNQVSERMRLDQMEPSEVMVIHRMFIKLEELDLGELEGAEKVKRLYVFADAVEVGNGSSFWSFGPVARLPGSLMIVILCRVLCLTDTTSSDSFNIQLPHMRLRVVEISRNTLRMYRVDDSMHEDYPAFCIHADIIQFSIGGMSAATRVGIFRIRSFESPLRNVVFSSEERSLVDHPLSAFHTRTEFFNFTEQVPMPEYSTINPASLATQSYSINIGGSGWGGQSTGGNEQLRPAYSLLQPNIPSILLTDPSILLAMQTSVLIAELVELAHPSPDTTAAVVKHVEWLNKILLQASAKANGTSSHDEYLALLFRAQYLMKTMGRTRSFVVPQLQYDVYSNLINRMAQVAESYDQSLRQFQLFVAQNKILGGYVLEQNRAFADKERDMDVFHSELISQRKIELQNTLLKMDQLSLQMETQTEEMEQAKEDMDEGLRQFRNREVANAMFAVFRAIAAIGLAFVTGGATAPAAMTSAKRAVSAAGQAAKALERVLEIMDDLQAVMELVVLIKELVENLQNINQLVDAPAMPEMPTEADWSIFVNEIEGVAEQMPTEVSEVSVWKTKCKNVAVLGREMMSTAAYISELQYDIQVQAMLQDIAKSHAARLSSIQAADLSSYTEMITQMDMRTTRLLVALIKVVFMQNAALLYQCLSPPTPINAWPVTMETLWSMLVQHEHAAILGLMRLGPAFDFMRTFVVKEIPVSLLLDGEDWEFEIPVQDFTIFPVTWSRVRIHHLEMKFVQEAHVHQPTTDTGKVYILLQGSRIFHDRSEAEALHYEASMPLDYHYAYHLDTGETTLSNLPSNDFIKTFMRMTPFTNWRLRLSGSAEENKGLTFPTATAVDSTTQIAITFYISAIRRISL